MAKTINPQEIAQFAKDSSHWWDEDGPFAPLHRLNPVRLEYLTGKIRRHYGRDPSDLRPFKGLSVIDIGCGGGLVCEPMARLGAAVTGVDADSGAIAVAAEHAAASGLAIDYRSGDAGDIKQTFDIVLALEVVEHVDDVPAFLEIIARLCRPGGLVILSTLNRTPQSFALGIVAAEYILRWVPRGTHRWKKFMRPSELARHLRAAGLDIADVSGLTFDPLRGEFKISQHRTAVNYFITATGREKTKSNKKGKPA